MILPSSMFGDAFDMPAVGFRFAVLFLFGGATPNPLDTRFQRVSGLSMRVDTRTVSEGGQNLYSHRLPRRVQYENLVLERGFVVGSPLNIGLVGTLSTFQFVPSTVIVTLLDDDAAPLAAWLFMKAYPVRWFTADLNASEERVLIDTIELAYTRMQPLRM